MFLLAPCLHRPQLLKEAASCRNTSILLVVAREFLQSSGKQVFQGAQETIHLDTVDSSPCSPVHVERVLILTHSTFRGPAADVYVIDKGSDNVLLVLFGGFFLRLRNMVADIFHWSSPFLVPHKNVVSFQLTVKIEKGNVRRIRFVECPQPFLQL